MKSLVARDPEDPIFTHQCCSGEVFLTKTYLSNRIFKKMLCDLINEGCLQQGDALMADLDKKLNIETEVGKCGLRLNIPTFAAIAIGK